MRGLKSSKRAQNSNRSRETRNQKLKLTKDSNLCFKRFVLFSPLDNQTDQNEPNFDHEHDKSLTYGPFKNLLELLAIWPHQGWPTLFTVHSYVVKFIVKFIVSG